ncbi:(2Fe-2S) ferredoxin domain-containing protein [Chengkuizengella axinellae]|uniref:(2Fe-2S) ferredoxin domain-containing protein n=1 Tax=Chengkuizengella axinellae TaxID=3064388 RepID=A0ABT9J1B5_9BACL|nr:(2Fe-2S) ferredoxin domain-containing protein [Chengkuizengella sp. 2205SS18-9]MDP5275411.1 (2Fe-2S) ferredoxin domain-containing protein [Chengkuizengella sp. 2205SS18-9]
MATWNLTTTNQHVFICNGGSCKKEGAEELTQSIRKEITNKGLDQSIHTTRTLCNGRCEDKCVVITYPEGVWYKGMTSQDAPKFIESIRLGQRLEDKISHTYNGEGFTPSKGTKLGKMKDEETVKKVSKIY